MEDAPPRVNRLGHCCSSSAGECGACGLSQAKGQASLILPPRPHLSHKLLVSILQAPRTEVEGAFRALCLHLHRLLPALQRKVTVAGFGSSSTIISPEAASPSEDARHSLRARVHLCSDLDAQFRSRAYPPSHQITVPGGRLCRSRCHRFVRPGASPLGWPFSASLPLGPLQVGTERNHSEARFHPLGVQGLLSLLACQLPGLHRPQHRAWQASQAIAALTRRRSSCFNHSCCRCHPWHVGYRGGRGAPSHALCFVRI